MKRREFSLAVTSVASTIALGAASSVHAQGAAPKEGKEYVKLSKPASTEAPAGKVEVVEFFWYSCPHCNAFEPTFAAWKQKAPAYVAVRRVPVAFNASFIPQQKLFFALQSMPNFDAMHVKVFHAIHVERNKLATDEAIFEWVGKQGVDVNKFKEAYNSFTVANQVRKASQLQQEYDVEGVPSMGVAGKFYTDGPRAGSMQNVLNVVDYLAAQSQKA